MTDCPQCGLPFETKSCTEDYCAHLDKWRSKSAMKRVAIMSESNEIKLGELEFRLGDFNPGISGPALIKTPVLTMDSAVEIANRLLRERLGRAVLVNRGKHRLMIAVKWYEDPNGGPAIVDQTVSLLPGEKMALSYLGLGLE